MGVISHVGAKYGSFGALLGLVLSLQPCEACLDIHVVHASPLHLQMRLAIDANTHNAKHESRAFQRANWIPNPWSGGKDMALQSRCPHRLSDPDLSPEAKSPPRVARACRVQKLSSNEPN
jgi:hypothetical protein